MKIKVQNGADNLAQATPLLTGKRLGLITNPTGINRALQSTADVLQEQYTLCALFAPEHGVRGDAQAGADVESYTDRKTGLPVYSMYGNARAESEKVMASLDLILFDIQDVGARFYTYLYTMTQAMTVCQRANIPFVVLDRINPIGEKVEGSVLDPRFSSFVGKYATPTRSGLTIGEFAHYVNETQGIHCALTVVPCTGWNRKTYYDQTDLVWVAPSPNIPTIDTALTYIGTCLFEGTNLSEGRGTTKPFELIGAPWLDAQKVIAEIAPQKGCCLRETYFTPTFSKWAGELCAGIQIHITDRETYQPFILGLRLVETIRRLHPQFEFLENHFIDLLLGSDAIRQPDFSVDLFVQEQRAKLQAFQNEAKEYRIYQ